MSSLAAIEVLDHKLVKQLLRLTTGSRELLDSRVLNREALELPNKWRFDEQLLVILAPERQVVREHPCQSRHERVTDLACTLGEGDDTQPEAVIQQFEKRADVAAEGVAPNARHNLLDAGCQFEDAAAKTRSEMRVQGTHHFEERHGRDQMLTHLALFPADAPLEHELIVFLGEAVQCRHYRVFLPHVAQHHIRGKFGQIEVQCFEVVNFPLLRLAKIDSCTKTRHPPWSRKCLAALTRCSPSTM